MNEINRMIDETHEWRIFHRRQYQMGIRGAAIEASACAIRLVALKQAKEAILREQGNAQKG